MEATARFNTEQTVDSEIAQKRILWIIVASGVFLLAVLGAALLLYSPASHSAPAPVAIKTDVFSEPKHESRIESNPYITESPFSESENTNGAQENSNPYLLEQDSGAGNPYISENTNSEQNKIPSKAENAQIYIDNSSNYYTTGTTIDLNAMKNKEPSPVTAINQTAAKAISATEAKKNKAAAVSTSPAATKKPATSASTSAKAKSSAGSATTKATASGKIPDRFWVQVGSFNSNKKADEARTALEEKFKGIGVEVFTFEQGTTLWYRVRVGPYTTKSEAEYWKKNIEEGTAFKNTTIFNSSAKAK